MAVKLLADQRELRVKKSTLPNAGKGLFTRAPINKGTRITEYEGTLTTWKAIQDNDDFNGYVYYITRNYVIDGKAHLSTFGRYANDARGMVRVPGVSNNAEYVIAGKKVYIQATRQIAAGEEILVGYGKEYWDVIKHNIRLAEKEKNKGRRSGRKK